MMKFIFSVFISCFSLFAFSQEKNAARPRGSYHEPQKENNNKIIFAGEKPHRTPVKQSTTVKTSNDSSDSLQNKFSARSRKKNLISPQEK